MEILIWCARKDKNEVARGIRDKLSDFFFNYHRLIFENIRKMRLTEGKF